jgi:hypothetical protein
MLLIYRGHTFQRLVELEKPYRHPVALNWRYRLPDRRYDECSRSRPTYHPPRAINWRWQPPSSRYF